MSSAPPAVMETEHRLASSESDNTSSPTDDINSSSAKSEPVLARINSLIASNSSLIADNDSLITSNHSLLSRIDSLIAKNKSVSADTKSLPTQMCHASAINNLAYGYHNIASPAADTQASPTAMDIDYQPANAAGGNSTNLTADFISSLPLEIQRMIIEEVGNYGFVSLCAVNQYFRDLYAPRLDKIWATGVSECGKFQPRNADGSIENTCVIAPRLDQENMDREKQNPFIWALNKGSVATLEKLFKYGLDPNCIIRQQKCNGKISLCPGCLNRSPQYGVPCKAKFREASLITFAVAGFTTIYQPRIFSDGRISIIQTLLKHGANPNDVDRDRDPLLILAINPSVFNDSRFYRDIRKLVTDEQRWNQVMKLVTILLKNGASVTQEHDEAQSRHLGIADFEDFNDQETPLHAACYNGPVKLLEIMLDHCKSSGIDSVWFKNQTLLHSALGCDPHEKGNRLRKIQLLLDHGASPSVQDSSNYRRTPLGLANYLYTHHYSGPGEFNGDLTEEMKIIRMALWMGKGI